MRQITAGLGWRLHVERAGQDFLDLLAKNRHLQNNYSTNSTKLLGLSQTKPPSSIVQGPASDATACAAACALAVACGFTGWGGGVGCLGCFGAAAYCGTCLGEYAMQQ